MSAELRIADLRMPPALRAHLLQFVQTRDALLAARPIGIVHTGAMLVDSIAVDIGLLADALAGRPRDARMRACLETLAAALADLVKAYKPKEKQNDKNAA